MPLSHQYKCIYIHIPKTGGVSIEHALDMLGDNEKENRDVIYGKIKSLDLEKYSFLSPVMQHLSIIDLKKIIPEKEFKEYYKFAIVRNPWDRMVSLYHFTKPYSAKEGNTQENISKFDEFLFHGLNPFLKQQQCDFISDDGGNIVVDYVGRFENISSDFKNICLHLGLPSISLPHKNRIYHRHYSTYYSEETKQYVSDLFRKDIETFGYRFEYAGPFSEVKKQAVYYFVSFRDFFRKVVNGAERKNRD